MDNVLAGMYFYRPMGRAARYATDMRRSQLKVQHGIKHSNELKRITQALVIGQEI